MQKVTFSAWTDAEKAMLSILEGVMQVGVTVESKRIQRNKDIEALDILEVTLVNESKDMLVEVLNLLSHPHYQFDPACVEIYDRIRKLVRK